MWPRLLCQRPQIRACIPIRDRWEPQLPGTRGPPRAKTEAGAAYLRSHCPNDPLPSAPPFGPPRGPRPSRSRSGRSPKFAQSREPQFRRREPRTACEGRGPEPLPSAIGLGAWPQSRKSRPATSAGSEGAGRLRALTAGVFRAAQVRAVSGSGNGVSSAWPEEETPRFAGARPTDGWTAGWRAVPGRAPRGLAGLSRRGSRPPVCGGAPGVRFRETGRGSGTGRRGANEVSAFEWTEYFIRVHAVGIGNTSDKSISILTESSSRT